MSDDEHELTELTLQRALVKQMSIELLGQQKLVEAKDVQLENADRLREDLKDRLRRCKAELTREADENQRLRAMLAALAGVTNDDDNKKD